MSETDTQPAYSGDPSAKALLIAAKAYARGLGDREPSKDEALTALREMSECIDFSTVKFGDELYGDTPLRRLVEIAHATSGESHWSEAVRRFVSPTEPAVSPPLADEALVPPSQTVEEQMAKRGEGNTFWVILALGAAAALALWIWGASVKRDQTVSENAPVRAMSTVERQQHCRIIRLTLAMSQQQPTSGQVQALAYC